MDKLRTALATIGVLGIGLAVVGSAAADKKRGDVKNAPAVIRKPAGAVVQATPCANATADRAAFLGRGDIAAEVSSTRSYGTAGCDKFVVNIRVNATSTPTGRYYPDVAFWHDPVAGPGPSDKAKCESSVVSVEYFRRVNGQSAFSKVGGGTIKGVWNAGTEFQPCSLVRQPGFQDPPAKYSLPSNGTDDYYRVAISYKQLNQRMPVKAGLRHIPFPPS
jgi:hypothetical protein